MKRLLFLLLLLAVPVLLIAAEPVREWTSKSGKTIRAAFDAANDTDPETVYLLKDGERYKIPFKKLSPADQEYVTKVRASVRDLDPNNPAAQEGGSDEKFVPPGRRFALLIGVNRYAKPIKSLQYCVKDMELLAECFQKSGMPSENIILVTDDSPFERRPTGGNIRRQIEVLTSIMEPDDQLVVAFSGHGAMVDGESYLCPSDTDLKDKNSIVPRDWVFEQLEKCKAKQKVFIIDACRNEISFDGMKAIGDVQTLEDPIGAGSHGFILIASCDKKQQSWEHPDIQHGVFTYFFAQGLAGAAKNEDGYVTIMSLFRYASSRTKKFVYVKRNELQVPTFRQGGEMTDFCLARVENPASSAASSVDHRPVSSSQTPSGPLKAGDRQVFEFNGVEFAFRYCPPGTFIMGATEEEFKNVVKEYSKKSYIYSSVANEIINSGNETCESPHQVTLTKGFWIMETEVTQEQWKAVMGENSSLFKGDNLPVNNVSWEDCQKFCKKCMALGFPVQLPTEAQWEYACRAGTTGPFAGKLEEMSWCTDKPRTDVQDIFSIPHPVGKKKPNAWGLYDMHGNVSEWCQDWFDYEDYPTWSVTDPEGPSDGECRVVRGGGLGTPPWDWRSASRRIEVKYPGFRCVKMDDNSAPVLPPASKAGERYVLKVNGMELAFRWCPPGTYTMGSPKSEPGRARNETQRQVTLTKGFWIMETEVTVGMFKAFVDDTGYVSRGSNPVVITDNTLKTDSNYSWQNPGFSQDDSHPVTCVSWSDAVEFCTWLKGKTGLNFRIPTEAQWEYACRAGSTTALPNGSFVIKGKNNVPALDPIAWYSGNCSQGFTGHSGADTSAFPETQYPGGPCGTHPVGKKNPNNWGLYDMIGNVSEWCAVGFDEYFNGGAAPTGAMSDDERFTRGGNWIIDVDFCRSASRVEHEYKDRCVFLGFRVSIVQ